MAIEIISRTEAQARGLKRYFTSVPCRHGHIAERYTCSERCFECDRIFRDARSSLRAIHHKRWRDRNPNKNRAKAKKWRAENVDRAISREKRWRAENPEKIKETKKKWFIKNPGKQGLYKSRRRALKANASGSYTLEQIAELFKKQNGKCANCFCSIKCGWEKDHIIALSRGGSNFISNIQLLCMPCNRSKHAKDPILWAQQNGRLL